MRKSGIEWEMSVAGGDMVVAKSDKGGGQNGNRFGKQGEKIGATFL